MRKIIYLILFCWAFLSGIQAHAEPAIIGMTGGFMQENFPVGYTAATFQTADSESQLYSYTYTLVAGAGSEGNTNFEFVGNALKTLVSFDYEAQSSYSVRIRSTNNIGEFIEQVFTITILNDPNDPEAPTDIYLNQGSFYENNAINDVIGSLVSVDANSGNTFTYALVSGIGDDDNNSFNINGNQLRASVVFNFELKNNFSIRIRSTDNTGLSFEKNLFVNIANANESPTNINLTSTTIAENNAVNATVGTLSSVDQDAGNTFTYSLVAGTGSTDNASFNINGTLLRASAAFDFETKNSYSIRIRTTDQGGLFFDKVFTISVIDVSEGGGDTTAPLLASFSPEDNATGVALDADLVVTFNEDIVGANGEYVRVKRKSDNTIILSGRPQFETDLFTISNNTLTIHLANYNVNAPASATEYFVEIVSGAVADLSGNNFAGFTDNNTWTFTTEEANLPPTNILLSNSSFDENGPVNTVIGTFSTTDANIGDSFTYSLVAGTGSTHNTSFNINGNQLRTSFGFDYEILNTFSIRVRVTDNGGLLFEKQFTISVNNVNEATPGDVYLSTTNINENEVTNTIVGIFTTADADGEDSFTYSLVAGTGSTDNASFNINGDQLRASESFDYETKNSYSIRVRTTDSGGLFLEKEFTITVVDVNEGGADTTPPTIVSFSPADGASDVSLGQDLVVSFSEDIVASSGFIRVWRDPSNFLIAGTADFDTDQISISGNTLTIHLSNPNGNVSMAYSTSYYVHMLANCVTDIAGNQFEDAFQDNTTWNFTTEAAPDVTPPLVNSTYPTIGGTYADLGGACNIIFNENVQLGNGSFALHKADGTLIETVPIGTGDSRASLAAPNRVSVIFDAYYEPLTQYYIVVTNGAVQDLAGNLFAGFVADEWNFTSNPVPLVSELSPADGAVNVPLNTNLTILFDQTVYGYDYANANSNIYVHNYDTDELLMTINTADMSFTNGLITITLPSDLPDNSHFYILDDPDGTFESDVSELFAGFTSKDDWDFYTGKLTQTVTIDPIADKLITDAPFAVSGSSTSGLTLAFEIISGPASIVGNTITLDGTTGTVEVQATQVGDDNYNAASATISFNVTDPSKTDQTITFDALASKTFGDAAFDLTATASSGLAVDYTSSNTAVATISGSTVTIVGAGSTTITASQSGDATFNPASAVQQVLTVNKADQTITIDPIVDKLTTDAVFDIVASTTSNLTLSYAVLSGPATTTGSTITLNGTTGTVTVEVSQAGDSNYNSASVQTNFEVTEQPAKQDQTITFEALTAVTFGDASFELSAVASSGLVVVYTSSDESVATISGATVTIVGAGSTTITATQDGDADFNAAVPVEQMLTVNKAGQTITFNPIEDQFVEAEILELSATASSGLIVTFNVTSGPASLNGTTLNFDGIGEVTIEAQQAGNANYEAATSTQTFEIVSVTGTNLTDRKPEIRVYPNPASEYITLSGLENQNTRIYISDMKGNLVKQVELSIHQTIDISDLLNGMYLIQTNDQTIRFIKK